MRCHRYHIVFLILFLSAIILVLSQTQTVKADYGPYIIADDNQTSFWQVYDSRIVMVDNATIQQFGSNCLETIWTDVPYGYKIYHIFAPNTQNWSRYDYVSFRMYGANSGRIFQFEIVAYPGGNFWYSDITDNFTGWRTFKLYFDTDLVVVGSPDITNIYEFEFMNIEESNCSGTWYFDRWYVDYDNGWHEADSWSVMVNATASWHSTESWVVRARTVENWRTVESWNIRLYANASFHAVESWNVTVITADQWNEVESWVVMVNATSSWKDIEDWTVLGNSQTIGFHHIETWTIMPTARKTVLEWDPAIQFSLPGSGTYVGFDDTAYFDGFSWNAANTTITFTNIYMGVTGSPIPSLECALTGGNVSFSDIDYLERVAFRFYANIGTIVSLSLTGLDGPPVVVEVDGTAKTSGTVWLWDGTTFSVGYAMPATTSEVVLTYTGVSTVWHEAEAWDIGLNPPGGIIANVTWFYRSNTITANSITGYEFSATMSSTLVNVSQNLGVSAFPVEFGFTVSMVNSHNESVLLMGNVGSPTGIITRSAVGEGFGSASADIPTTALNLGLDTIDVKLYVRLSGSSWLLTAEFTTQRLMYTKIIGSTIQFNLYTKMSFDGSGNTVATCYWGDSTHTSGISGLSLKTPTPQEIAIYYAGQGDWLHAVLYPYMIYAGDLFYGLGLFFVGGVLYLRHKKWEVILVCLFLFGGPTGLGFLIPDAAYRLIYIVVALALTWLLTRVFK